MHYPSMFKAWGGVHLVVGLTMALTACDSGSSVSDTGEEDGDSGEEEDSEEDSNAEAEDEAGSEDTASESGDTTEDNGPATEVACVSLIDDLEGLPPLIPVTDGRAGAWYTYNDNTEGATQTPPPCGTPFSPAEPGARESLYAARSTGSGFSDWGAGFGFDLNNMGMEPTIDEETGECVIDYSTRMTYDASAYTGISFYAKSFSGNLNIDVKIPALADTPIEEGGACDVADGQCGNSYQAIATLKGTWQGYEVPFDSFAQGSWGQRQDLDLATLVGVQFQTRANAMFDIAIDHVCFY